MSKRSKVLLAFILVLITLINYSPSLATAQVKINDWPLMKEAIKFEGEKNYTKAIYYYEELVKLYSNYNTIYSQENGGHFAMRAGNYYSGLLNADIFLPDKATYYYEKAYNFYLKFSELSGDSKNNWAFITAKKRLDDIKTTIDLYIENEVKETTTSRALAKHEPKNGMYLGIYRTNSSNTNLTKELFGKEHASVLYYNDFGISTFPVYASNEMKKINGSIQIHIMPINGLDSVVDGDYIRKFAKEAKKSEIPIFIRFGGEMNGDWVKWGLQPEKYIEKFRLIHDIFKEEAPNVAMVWAPNFFPWDGMNDYYPGDEYVDWVGLSLYTFLNYDKDSKESKLKSNPIDLLQYIVKDYGSRKPIMIVEGAASIYSTTEPNIDYTNWAANNIRRFYSYIPLVYPEVKAMYYFDSLSITEQKQTPIQDDKKDLKREFLLTSNQVIQDTYKEIIQNEYFLSNMESSSNIKYEKVIDSINKKEVKLSTYVKTFDPNISKVEYYVDGKLVHTSKVLPYDFKYDFSKYTTNTTKITIKVYDSNNKLIGIKDYTLNFK